MIVQRFDLNMIPDQAPVVVHCDQYDRGTGRLVISLYNGSVTYTPPSGSTAVIQGYKPDRKGFQYSATLSGNTVTANITEQMTAKYGDVRCQIIVTETSGRVGSFAFILRVQKSALPADTDMSESEFDTIVKVLDVAEEIEQYADQVQTAVTTTTQKAAEASTYASNASGFATSAARSESNARTYESNAANDALVSEGWAKGTQNGTAVGSSSPYYHKNSKYYSEQASTSATASASSASDSASSASNSATSASNSAASATASATSATTSGTKAQDSEAWATGQRNGVDVPSTDPTYHNNAKYYAGKSNGGALTGLDDVAIQNIKNGQFIEYDSTEQKYVNKMVKTTLSGTLNAGQTSITFNNAAITPTVRVSAFVEDAYIELEDITVGANTLTLVFPEQDQNINIKVVLIED